MAYLIKNEMIPYYLEHKFVVSDGVITNVLVDDIVHAQIVTYPAQGTFDDGVILGLIQKPFVDFAISCGVAGDMTSEMIISKYGDQIPMSLIDTIVKSFTREFDNYIIIPNGVSIAITAEPIMSIFDIMVEDSSMDSEGNVYYVGNVYVNGHDITNAKKLATEEYVNSIVYGEVDTTKIMEMINNLHYYANKNIVMNSNLFTISSTVLTIDCSTIIDGSLVVPYDLGNHSSLNVINPENVTKIIIPREMNLINGNVMKDEDLLELFVNLKTIVRIHEDGATLSYNVETSELN